MLMGASIRGGNMDEAQKKNEQTTQKQHQLNEGVKINSGKSIDKGDRSKNCEPPRGARPPRNEK